jgi:hypothetical protein
VSAIVGSGLTHRFSSGLALDSIDVAVDPG